MKYKYSKKQKQNAQDMRNNPTLHETILWKYLKNSQLNGLKFRRQQPIGKYIVDFCCFYPKIIIELDDGQHNIEDNIEYDKARDEFLKNEGYQVIRIWNNDITNNIDGVIQYLKEIITHPEIKDFDFTSRQTLHRSVWLGRVLKGGYGKTITVQCPAKVNLTLKVTGKRPDGFHNIESIMQTISLYDYLIVNIKPSDKLEIKLSGNSTEIPYNEKNLVYKAAMLFLNRHSEADCEILRLKAQNDGAAEESRIKSNYEISIYIEKHIPVAAGLAGGSTDAAGTLFALNELFNKPFTKEELHKLCSELGSDLNVCLEGGKLLCKGRGEIIEPMDYEEFNLSLIKPKNLGISAKEAYTKFAEKNTRPEISNNFTLSPTLPPQGGGSKSHSSPAGRGTYANDLEWAIIDDYPQLQKIKTLYPTSQMSGSGSTYFRCDGEFDELQGYDIYNNLKSENKGIQKKARS